MVCLNLSLELRRNNDEGRCRFITIAASFLSLAVAIGSSIVTGEYFPVLPSCPPILRKSVA